ncbi:hypothetical protein RhiirA5_430277 [Rhizophagus irregularis]|uniref:Uncharacterized protein n=1 Tax=Rhizophagus irregularis TaxID=588596 RepID=A0A2N0NX10_9GLOM|nr:hypothetical protein RhiirA5_430277 [Rhizophagus irregularis]
MPRKVARRKVKQVVKRKRTSYSVEQKIEVIKYAEEYGNNKAAEHFDIHCSMVGRWVKASLTWNIETNGKSKRVGSGRKAFFPEAKKRLEVEILELYGELTENFKTSHRWLVGFLKRYKLALRRCTRIFQKLPSKIQEQLEKFNKFFDIVGNFTINPKGEKTVHIRAMGNEKNWFTIVLTCAAVSSHAQVIILNDRECECIMSPFRQAFRKKLRFSWRMPTAIINHNLIYNIKDIADNQLVQAKGTNFLIQLNDTGLLGKITMLRLKQLQYKFWIEDNIVSVFPFDNNFYKKLFYKKYKITGGNVPVRNILGTEKFFNNIHRIKKDGIIEDTRNYIKPKKWYRELQNIVTIDGKLLKLKYKMSAVSHFKRNNNIEIGVLIKKSGIDGQKNYEKTINQSVISIDRLVKINDNLITKLLDFSHDQNQLLIIQRQLLESSTRKFEIYTDGSVRGFGSQQSELLAVILALIVLPNRNNFIISPRKFFKIRTNNIYWSILRVIIVTNNLTLDFIKVKGHSDDYFNNYIDEFITHTDELSNLKKILNLNQNGKYRHLHVNVNWHYTFLLLNRDIEDKVELTYFTSMFSSKRKKQSVNLLTEEIPTVEKRKYLAYKIFDFFCEQHDETFDHVWMCESRADEMNTIICKVKEFFEETCNFLLVEAKKDPIIDNELINKMTFWDHTYSETKITFIDLIKGIISCELAACLKQKEKERKLKVNLKKVKENLNEDKYIDPNRKINQLNLFSGLERVSS